MLGTHLLSLVPGDPFGHENQIIKDVGLETIHSIPRETAPSPSPSPPCAIHSLNSGWELGSHSAHLLSISLVAFSQFHISEKKKIPLKTTNTTRWRRGRKGPVAAGRPVGGRGLGREGRLSGWRPASAPAVPSQWGKQLEEVVPGVWGGMRASYQKWFGS